jgi:hypothetical protein
VQIISRMSISADGYVTTPDGWPAQLADPAFVSGQSHGIRDFLVGKEAALMGRRTFEPALTADRWPWPNLNVFVLGSQRPAGTPDHVVTDSDPLRLLERLRAANQGGDIHLIGGLPHDRDLPRPRSARQARTGRPAVAAGRRNAADVVAQPRHRADVRAGARASGRVGGDRLRLQREVAPALAFDVAGGPQVERRSARVSVATAIAPAIIPCLHAVAFIFG